MKLNVITGQALNLLGWVLASLVLVSSGRCDTAVISHRPDMVIADFEGTNFGGWKVAGDAFGDAPAHGAVSGQMPVDGFLGGGLASSFHNDDSSLGTLTSPSFKAERKYIQFLIGGGGFAGQTCINLLCDGKVVRTATGPNTQPGGSEHLAWQAWDVSQLTDKSVVLEIVDQATGGWGHISVDQIVQSDNPPLSPQAQFIKEANAYVDSKAVIVQTNPVRPIYHVMPKAQSMGDPNGPVYFNGEYHIFFQHFPKHGIVWGHAVSKDMVHWEHLPIALAPEPGSYDADGIASGGCVIHDGVPTIIYTSFSGKQAQCIATSSDNLRTWRKDPANPVIPEQPAIAGLDNGFRDPFTWREGNEWRMLVGSGYAKGKGGTVLLYHSTDLRKWNFLGPLCEGMGEHCFQWECPTFFPLGDSHVLIVSPLYRDIPGLRGPSQYSVGTYRMNRFEPAQWKPVDLGGPSVYYAPTSFEDQKHRRILWGFLMASGAGWGNCLSLPRVLTLGKDSSVRCAPLPELKALRTRERDGEKPTLQPEKEVVLDEALGLHGEVDIELDMQTAEKIELRIGRTADGQNYVPLAYDKTTGNLVFGKKKAQFRLDADNRLRIHLFTDGAVAEAFINEEVCFSQAMPVTEKSVGLSIVASGGNARVTRCRLWEMTSIWPAASKEVVSQ